jgi:hypothetical protein
MSKKILNHPDKDEIVKKLVEGESVRSIEEWLKKRHSDSKKHVTYITLHKFRKDYLNIQGEYLSDIQEIRKARDDADKEEERKEIVKNSSPYKEKLEEIVDAEIDVTRRLLEMEALVNSRLEYYFNVLQSGGSLREDKIFIEYINILRSIMADWKKFIEGHSDNKIEHNVNVNVMMQQVTIIKNVVSDVLLEMDSEKIPVFIDKLNQKMGLVDYEKESEKLSIEKVDDFGS